VATAPEALLPLHHYLYDLGCNEIQVQAAYGSAGYEGRDAIVDLRDLADWYRGLLLAGVVISILPFTPLLERLQLRGASVLSWYPCNAALAALAIDGSGYFYPCHHFLGETACRLGHVSDGIPALAARRRWFVNVLDREPCRACWARHLCGGECYHRLATAGHDYGSAVPEWCRVKQALIQEGVDLFTAVAARRPQSLEALLDFDLFVPPVNRSAFTLENLEPYHTR
jgi:radical SAM protein with 4Fe4S-binding SPASM domain